MRRSESRPPDPDASRTSSESLGFEPDSLARYDSLVRRISALESERVDYNTRQAETTLKGLMQTLHSYEGTLHELHRLSNERKLLTMRAMGSFDFLGKKHKDKKVVARRQKELKASNDELAQIEKISRLTVQVNEQRKIVLAWRRKARELDYVRQCEADLVDRVFRGQDVENEQHDALEEAVCALAPRVMAMRESWDNFAVLKSKCETAAVQQREASGNLQRTFQSSHRVVQDARGESPHERDHSETSTDQKARSAALDVAEKLVKLSVLNLRAGQARLSKDQPTLFLEEDIQSLERVLEPLMGVRLSLTTPQAEAMAENAIHIIDHHELQTRRAAQELDKMASSKNSEMQQIEEMMLEYKLRLDDQRRDLLSERLPSMERCPSAPPLPPGRCSVYTEEEFDKYTRKHSTNSSSTLSSLGEKASSISSDLFRLGSAHSLA